MAAHQGWREHAGFGCPVPVGTLVDVRRFNGDVDRFNAGHGPVIDDAGNPISCGKGRWSCWNHFDGGPKAVKARTYRVVEGATAYAAHAAENRTCGHLIRPQLAESR